jgi:hypothetical protein
MSPTRFIGTLNRADEPACQTYARVTVIDTEGTVARACPRARHRRTRRHHRRPGGLGRLQRA